MSLLMLLFGIEFCQFTSFTIKTYAIQVYTAYFTVAFLSSVTVNTNIIQTGAGVIYASHPSPFSIQQCAIVSSLEPQITKKLCVSAPFHMAFVFVFLEVRFFVLGNIAKLDNVPLFDVVSAPIVFFILTYLIHNHHPHYSHYHFHHCSCLTTHVCIPKGGLLTESISQ